MKSDILLVVSDIRHNANCMQFDNVFINQKPTGIS